MGFVRFLRLGWGLYSEGVHLTFVFPLFFSQIGPFFFARLFFFCFLLCLLSLLSFSTGAKAEQATEICARSSGMSIKSSVFKKC